MGEIPTFTRNETQMAIELCERITPTIVSSPQTGRFVAAFNTPCRSQATSIRYIHPADPDEFSFEVGLCAEHEREADTYEPLNLEEGYYVFCGECKSYADVNGNCGCP